MIVLFVNAAETYLDPVTQSTQRQLYTFIRMLILYRCIIFDLIVALQHGKILPLKVKFFGSFLLNGVSFEL